jgi:hypothetical protein
MRQYADQDAQGTTAAEEQERIRDDAPPVPWEDQWVDIGGEG